MNITTFVCGNQPLIEVIDFNPMNHILSSIFDDFGYDL